MQKIICNKIQCTFCKDIIESHNAHDYVVCKCGKCACYGGLQELKRDFVYSHEDYIELSIIENVENDGVVTEDEYSETRKYRNKRNKHRKGR